MSVELRHLPTTLKVDQQETRELSLTTADTRFPQWTNKAGHAAGEREPEAAMFSIMHLGHVM